MRKREEGSETSATRLTEGQSPAPGDHTGRGAEARRHGARTPSVPGQRCYVSSPLFANRVSTDVTTVGSTARGVTVY